MRVFTILNLWNLFTPNEKPSKQCHSNEELSDCASEIREEIIGAGTEAVRHFQGLLGVLQVDGVVRFRVRGLRAARAVLKRLFDKKVVENVQFQPGLKNPESKKKHEI